MSRDRSRSTQVCVIFTVMPSLDTHGLVVYYHRYWRHHMMMTKFEVQKPGRRAIVDLSDLRNVNLNFDALNPQQVEFIASLAVGFGVGFFAMKIALELLQRAQRQSAR